MQLSLFSLIRRTGNFLSDSRELELLSICHLSDRSSFIFAIKAQVREQTLLEENSEYENAISICEAKIQEKKDEADSLLAKLKVSL